MISGVKFELMTMGPGGRGLVEQVARDRRRGDGEEEGGGGEDQDKVEEN